MKKAIFTIGFLLFIVISGSLYFILTNLDFLVRSAIEKYGSQVTRTSVSVNSVKITLADGTGAIDGLTISNPKGFDAPNAFSLDHISTKINTQSITQNPIVIDQIRIKAPQVYYEMNAERQTNLAILKDNIASSFPHQPEPSTETEPRTNNIRLIIHHLYFNEGTLNATFVPLDQQHFVLKLPQINLNDLGGKSGSSIANIAKEILVRLIDQAINEIKKQGAKKGIDVLQKEANDNFNRGKAKLNEKIDNKIEDQKQKVEEKFKDLFK